MIHLLPCPFCGAKMEFISNRDWHYLSGDHEENCVFSTGDNADILSVPATKDQMLALERDWNTRAPTNESVVKDKLTTDDHKAAAAVTTLEKIGFTYHGGVMWKPPIGKPAAQFKYDSQVIDEIRSMLIKCDCSECSLRNKPILEVLKILGYGNE